MFRIICWTLLAAFLIVVGLWPAAAAPVTLAATGAGALIAAIPGPVLLAAAVIAWLKHKPTPATARA
ncbi:hypothetical protein B0E38_06465 [Streptomyces sp. 111WW2]|uniref:hypothetical protein n=1 Tax=Streptomyces sp. 111WW2 TaxID=1945515 RepID=UPI000D0C8D1F|nr:hypothetical protein [Streptomyces sp. 111WW2]PSK47988.1 hypothetical protein B0E38_06465 [Streptomyces sp. 111WW2]